MKSSPLLTHLPIAPGYLKPLVTPEFIRTNIQEADALLGGFPKGGITEIYGPPSSGRTTLLLSFMQSATSQGEHCALIDASNSFDPQSAQKSGVDLKRLLWIRCPADNDKTRMEQALKCGDMLAHGGGWGAIILDLSDISPQWIHRVSNCSESVLYREWWCRGLYCWKRENRTTVRTIGNETEANDGRLDRRGDKCEEKK